MSPWSDGPVEKRHVLTTRTVWRGVIVLAFLLACGALVLSAVLSSRQSEIVRRNHHAIHEVDSSLCALRTDLQHRVDQTEKFLHHPESFPAFNDPQTLALIQNQVEGQQRTIDSLSNLTC